MIQKSSDIFFNPAEKLTSFEMGEHFRGHQRI